MIPRFENYFLLLRNLAGIWFVSGNLNFFQSIHSFDNRMFKDVIFDGWIFHFVYLHLNQEIVLIGNLWVKHSVKAQYILDYISFKVGVDEIQTVSAIKYKFNFRRVYS